MAEDFASLVLELWFEEKSLEEVLQRCRDLGQMELPPGFRLQGALAQCLARSEPVTFEAVKPWVQRLSGQEASKREKI